jgi:hypothetical protein
VVFNTGGVRFIRCRRELNLATLKDSAVLIQRKSVIGGKRQFKDETRASGVEDGVQGVENNVFG